MRKDLCNGVRGFAGCSPDRIVSCRSEKVLCVSRWFVRFIHDPFDAENILGNPTIITTVYVHTYIHSRSIRCRSEIRKVVKQSHSQCTRTLVHLLCKLITMFSDTETARVTDFALDLALAPLRAGIVVDQALVALCHACASPVGRGHL